MQKNDIKLSRQTILVIDDIEMNQAVVKKVFEDKYKVLVAKNGAEGMDILLQNEIELVLLDIVMPVMDGFEVLKAMKANPKTASIPVVVITGEIKTAEKKALELGADDFIEKPYDSYIMRKRVENLIERYQLGKLRNEMHEQRRYRHIFDILQIGYWEWTRDCGYYHSTRYDEYAISELSDGDIWDETKTFQCVHPDDIDDMKAFMQPHDADEIKRSAIIRCKMKDGTYRWTEMFSIAETQPDGDLARLVTIVRDVDREWTEQKELLQDALKKAEAANIAKTAFLSRVSHDMRTPLNGILGLTTILQDRITDPKIQQDLSDLELSGNYLLNLINDTLDISRIESGKLDLYPLVCDGREVYNNALTLAKTNAASKNVRINIHADNIPFTLLYVDAGRIEQVVMNVLGNAVKFTPEGGTIDVTMSNISIENGVITDKLVIADTGVGMSKEFLPHIFDAFAQEDITRTSNYEGTGLGMAITKQLMQRMGGEISVESELGKGTTFTLILKFNIATDSQIKEWKKHRMGVVDRIELRGKCILLCEDHPLNTTIATRVLKAKGMRVEHAENGQIGVDMFSRSGPHHYDAILMDIRMPVLDGIQATKAIRQLPRQDAKTVPIIAMTANAFADDVLQTRQAGMNAHLSKPIKTDVLYKTLSQALELDTEVIRKQVLVVDDVDINRSVIRSALEDDYDILEAENGKQALDIIESTNGIDAVITDIQMPEMSGLELIRAIRAKDAFRHIVIIANTQFGDPEQEEILLESGANDFVYKPTTPKIVEIRVRNALKRL